MPRSLVIIFQSATFDHGLRSGFLKKSLVYSESGCQNPSSGTPGFFIMTMLGMRLAGFVSSGATTIAAVGHSRTHSWHPMHPSCRGTYGFSIIHVLGLR